MPANAANRKRLVWGLAIAFGMFISFHPWPHYRWACFRDTVPSLESFVSRFPSSDCVAAAKDRIRVLNEPAVWAKASKDEDIGEHRHYIEVYPDGQHIDEAKRRLTAIADREWERLRTSRSESTIKEFLRSYPETSRTSDVRKRLQELYDDWSWVSEQNSVEAYRRFLDTFPNHPKAAFLGKRLIDLEVDLIAAGAHGYLPRAAAVDSSPHSEVANMRIENQTEYELTVRFSGVDSKMLVIQKKGTSTIELKAGSYRVAASVAARDVENYYGTDELDGGSYETRFYIKRTSVPGSYPRY